MADEPVLDDMPIREIDALMREVFGARVVGWAPVEPVEEQFSLDVLAVLERTNVWRAA